jgi:hypothetical protein
MQKTIPSTRKSNRTGRKEPRNIKRKRKKKKRKGKKKKKRKEEKKKRAKKETEEEDEEKTTTGALRKVAQTKITPIQTVVQLAKVQTQLRELSFVPLSGTSSEKRPE